jgi:hypothetical protein
VFTVSDARVAWQVTRHLPGWYSDSDVEHPVFISKILQKAFLGFPGMMLADFPHM